MAYQNVSIPRFYVNVIEWLHAMGVSVMPTDPDHEKLIISHALTLPIPPLKIRTDFGYIAADGTKHPLVLRGMTEQSFLAVLGHNIASVQSAVSGGQYVTMKMGDDHSEYVSGFNTTGKPSVNAGVNGWRIKPDYDGFSLAAFTGSDDITKFYVTGGDTTGYKKFGSVIIGTYYEMTNAPNLSLTMSREYDKKNITTTSGGVISNQMWNKASSWGEGGAWELYSGTPPNQALSRSGRRTWDLKFSYIGDGDLWGSNQMLSYSRQDPTDGLDDADTGAATTNFQYNILTDDNFYSQVWHKTLGGTLPFIFQPDKDNSNADGFAICKFKDSSLRVVQSAFHTYDVALKIEEVW